MLKTDNVKHEGGSEMKAIIEMIEEIESLPYGDMEKDKIILDNNTLEALKVCEELFAEQDRWDDLHFLVSSLIMKWETIQELLYA